MKLSWNQKLFFKINDQLGKRPIIDKIVGWVAQYGIYVHFLLIGFYLFLSFFSSNWLYPLLLAYVLIMLGLLFFSFIISWLIGYLFPQRRPIIEFPHSQELFTPLSDWKSFPSDHTMVSFLSAEVLYLLVQPITYVTMIIPIGFFLLAFMIGLSRVYAGVHYPNDVIGGILVAIFVFSMFIFFTSIIL